MVRVTARCRLGLIEEYVSAQQQWFPCCWIGNEPHATQLRHFLGDDLMSQLDTKHHDLRSIRNSPAFAKMQDSWTEGTFKGCVEFCGAALKSSESAAKRTRRDDIVRVNLRTMTMDPE